METVAIFHTVPKFLVARNSNSKIPRWIKVAPSPMISGENTILQLNAREWKVNRPTNRPTKTRERRYPEFIPPSNRYSIWFAEWNSLMQIFIAARIISLSRINRLTDRCFFRPVTFSLSPLKSPPPPQPFPQQFLWPFDKKIALRLLLIRLSFLDNSFLVSQ